MGMGDAPPGSRKNLRLADGHVRIINPVMEALAMAPFNAGQLRVLMVVIRKTWGWQTKDAEVSSGDLADATGLARSTAAAALRDLVDAGVLVELEAPSFSSAGCYQVQKDPEQWGRFAVSPPSLSGTPDTPESRTLRESGPDSPAHRTPVSGTPDTPAPESVGAQRDTDPLKTSSKERKDIQQIADAGDAGEQITAVIVAANRGMQLNETIDQARLRPIQSGGRGRQVVLDWLQDDIPAEFAAGVVHEIAAERYAADPANRQIKSMAYFDEAVREAWELEQAQNTEAPNGAGGRKGRNRNHRPGAEVPQRFDYSDATEQFEGFD